MRAKYCPKKNATADALRNNCLMTFSLSVENKLYGSGVWKMSHSCTLRNYFKWKVQNILQ